LSEVVGMSGNKFKFLSLGQGMENEATTLVETSG
jgi:hypothetical protein